jgi:hypothetical protein
VRRTLSAFVVIAAVVGGGLQPGPAEAAAPTHSASYKGRTIDLGRDWEDAKACAVLSATEIQCFDSFGELTAKLGGGPQDDHPTSHGQSIVNGQGKPAPATIDSYCLNLGTLWLTLYEDASFGGRSLSFRDTGIWQNLSTWTFDNMMTSWKNDTYCDAIAAWDASGGGSWLTMGSRSSSTNVGATWTNQASSIYITA